MSAGEPHVVKLDDGCGQGPTMPSAGGQRTTEKLLPSAPMLSTFGRYQVLQAIAQGGMAEIVLARALSGTARVCALKRILPQFSRDLQFVSMFIDEARITIGLNHDNVVRLYDFGQVDGVYFMAIEYVDGTDLAALLYSHAVASRALPPIVAASIVADVARGLGHAHHLRDAHGRLLGVVHRDVSPQNILLSSNGDVKITDFGIAAAKNKLTLTAPGIVLGKAAYMAPEQATGRKVDFRCDLWALGVILWESLVGDRLFASDNPVTTLHRMLHNPIPSPSLLRPEVPRALDAVVTSLLQRDVHARPGSADDVARALDDVVLSLARTSPLATEGRFGRAERARLLAAVDWQDSTGPMRPHAHAAPVPSPSAMPTRPRGLVDDADLAALVERWQVEQDPWLLYDVADDALKKGCIDVARSGFRTAAATFAFRGLLVQALIAHAAARTLMTPDDADADVREFGDLTPGQRPEFEALLARVDAHGLSGCAPFDERPTPSPVPLLGALGPRELARVAPLLGVRRVKKGDVVIREGERGNALYAVGRGRFVVSCAPGEGESAEPPLEDDDGFSAESTLDARPLHIARPVLFQQHHQGQVFLAGLADGDFFGEFSFLAERPRSATVEAITDGLLLEIDRDDVDDIAAVDPAFKAPLLAFYKERVVELMMARSPVFSLLGASDRRALLEGATVIDVDDGALIVREGAQSDSLFFIRRGEVEIFRRDAEGLTIFINKLGHGQFFGEIAALRRTPRTVSVRAIGPVSLFRIEGHLLHDIVDRSPHLKAMFDAMIARRAAETKERVLEHHRLLVET